ncbi:MAG: hypothetical protein GWN29_13935, partial [Gammaproteobacteria bacterium]|nr:hypothetical protein [Gammaproteobacteria bacterium]
MPLQAKRGIGHWMCTLSSTITTALTVVVSTWIASVPALARAQDETQAQATQQAYTLRRCVAHALLNSRSLREARFEVDVADAQVR